MLGFVYSNNGPSVKPTIAISLGILKFKFKSKLWIATVICCSIQIIESIFLELASFVISLWIVFPLVKGIYKLSS